MAVQGEFFEGLRHVGSGSRVLLPGLGFASGKGEAFGFRAALNSKL